MHGHKMHEHQSLTVYADRPGGDHEIERSNSSHTSPAVAALITEHKDKEKDIEEIYEVGQAVVPSA